MASRPLVRVLGPVELRGDGGPVPIPGALPRALLAALALTVPQPVSVDRLTMLLWGETPPVGVKAALQQIVSRVRRHLASAGARDTLHAAPPGYALAVDRSSIDVHVFRTSVRLGAEAARAKDHDRAAHLLGSGLDLWRGGALADLVELPLHRVAAPALDDERWRAEELRATSLLAARRPDDAARFLASATVECPLRERLWALLAESLVAAGRQDEAVRAVTTAIAVITAEIGAPPGPALTSLQHELLGSGAAVPRLTASRPQGAEQPMFGSALRRALANAERAATAAMGRFAHAEAIVQWQRALELLETIDPDDDAGRMRLLLGLGEARNMVGLDIQARSVFAEAIEIARRREDSIGFGWAVLGYCADRAGFAQPAEQNDLLDEALRKVPAEELRLRARLLARLAPDEYWTGSIDRSLDVANEAYEVAKAAGDVEGRLLALYGMAFGCWTPPRTRRLLEVCETYLDEAREAGDHRHELLARRWLVPAATELGDVARGAHEAALVVQLADELQLSEQQWVARVIASCECMVTGDLARAETLATEALTLGSVREPDIALDYVSIALWTLRWLQGRLDEIAALVQEAASRPGVDMARQMGLAVTQAELGRIAHATAILDGITPKTVAGLRNDSSWYIVMGAMAEAAALCNHRSTAELAHRALLPYRDRIAITSVSTSGPIAHQLGITAWVLGLQVESLHLLRESIELCDRSGMAAFGARSRIAMAERLVSIGERDEALRLAADALAVAATIGMRGVTRQAEAIAAGLSS